MKTYSTQERSSSGSLVKSSRQEVRVLLMTSSLFAKFSPLDCHGWSTISIRVIGILILMGLATLELRPLVFEYNYHNFGTEITIIGHNKTAKPPAVTLCIPWTSSQLIKIAEHLQKTALNQSSRCDYCEAMAKNGWDVWKSMDFGNTTCVHDYRLAMSEEIIRRLFQADDGFAVLNVTNYKWHYPIIDAVWDFLDCVQELDQHMGVTTQDNSSCGDRPGWCFLNQTADQFLSDPEKLDRLFDRMVDILCEYIEFRDENYALYNRSVCAATLNRLSSIIFGDQFCFALPDKDRFGSVITSKAQSKYGAKATINTTTYSRLFLYSDTDFVSFEGGNMNNGYPIYVSDGVEDVVRVGYVVTATVVERRAVDCYKERSPAVCRSKCMIKKIISRCGCVPFTFYNSVENVTDVPYCNSTLYSSCELDKATEMKFCQEHCSYPCNYTSYQWIVSRIGQNGGSLISNRRYSSGRQWRHFDIQLYPVTTTFMEFAVTMKNTPAQFLSQVAAILSLYLGFSGLTIIAFAIFFGKTCQRWCQSSKKGPDSPLPVTVFAVPESRSAELINYQSMQEMKKVIQALQAAVDEKCAALETRLEISQSEGEARTERKRSMQMLDPLPLEEIGQKTIAPPMR